MRKNNEKHNVNAYTRCRVLCIIALAVILTVTLIVCMSVFGGYKPVSTAARSSVKTPSGDVTLDLRESRNGMALSTSRVAADGNTYRLTATVKPDNADNKTVIWDVAWSALNDWSNGKNISEYISLSSATANPVTVTCNKAFGAQAVITCRLQDDSEVFATCSVDYRQKIDRVAPTITVGSNVYGLADIPSLPLAAKSEFSVNVTKTIGSKPTEYETSVTVKFSDECIAWMESEYSDWGTGYNNTAAIDDGGTLDISYLFAESNPNCLFVPNISGGIYGSSAGSMYFYQYLLPEFNNQTFPKLLFTVTVTDSNGQATEYKFKAKLDRITISAVSVELNSAGIEF